MDFYRDELLTFNILLDEAYVDRIFLSDFTKITAFTREYWTVEQYNAVYPYISPETVKEYPAEPPQEKCTPAATWVNSGI